MRLTRRARALDNPQLNARVTVSHIECAFAA
jgi:hypothetical protein